MFVDRREAGERLAKALEKYQNQEALVLAIPRGGVEVGYEVARYLNSNFSIIVSRKLPLPEDPEAGFGAIAEDGSIFIFEEVALQIPAKLIDRIIEEQKEEIKRRMVVLRKGRPLPKIANRTVILVDDGLAMGSTMRVSIMLCRNNRARKIVVAVPVSGENVAEEIGKMVDELVVLEKPPFFYAVAQVYRHWHDVSDKEVVTIVEKWERQVERSKQHQNHISATE